MIYDKKAAEKPIQIRVNLRNFIIFSNIRLKTSAFQKCRPIFFIFLFFLIGYFI